MTVLYSCPCVPEGETASVEIEERGTDEHIDSWMVKLQTALARDHRARGEARARVCAEKALAWVKVPTTPGLPIGRVTEGN